MSRRSHAYRVAFLTLGFFVSSSAAYAQGAVERLEDHLYIGQSLKDKNLIGKPAFVTLSLPDEGDDSNLVAVAASAFLIADPNNPQFNIGAGFQFNQNSAASARQNLFVAALDMTARTGGKDSTKEFIFLRATGHTGFKRNGEKDTRGLTASGYITLEKNRPGKKSSAIPIPVGDGLLEFTPQAGLEYDNVLAASVVTDEGTVTRGVLAVNINLFPAPSLGDRLVVSADLAYRRDLQTDLGPDDRNYRFAQLGVAVGLDKHGILSVALDRLVGKDPSQEFMGPNLTQISLKVKLGLPQKRSIVRARARTPVIHII